MKKLLLIFGLLATSLVAKESYFAYHYHDTHHVKTDIKQHIAYQQLEINATLHVQYLEVNSTHYALFWLERGEREKKEIDFSSIYAPFVVDYNADGFIIKALHTPSKDRKIYNKLMGIVEHFQFWRTREGRYKIPNALGNLEVNASFGDNHYTLIPLAQYNKKRKREDIRYYKESRIEIVEDNRTIWKQVLAKESVKFFINAMNSTIRDRRELNVTLSTNQLPKNHWFFTLPIDTSLWHFSPKPTISYSLQKADALFERKMAELKQLLDSDISIEAWVRENLDFLSYLDELLEGRVLDDMISKHLFAELGYIDTPKSVEILSGVSLNENIKSTERFRSLMGLKNTSAPIKDETLDRLLTMGLSGDGDNIAETMGLLIGALADKRANRVPSQYQKINDTLLNALSDKQDKSLILGAMGNMRQSASDEVVQEVGELLSNTQNNRERLHGAEALLQIHRSNLSLSQIKEMILSEKNSNTASILIQTTQIAKDSSTKRKQQYQFLTKIAQEQTRMKSNRISALKSLDKAGYGKSKEQKHKIRQMMLHEKDSDVQKILREIYRK